MKGLLIKDFELALVNKQMIGIFLFIAVAFMFSGSGESIAVAYFTMLCGMMVLTTISYDEFDHSNAFLLTMPVTRKLYAVEKYVLAFLLLSIGWGVSVATAAIINITGQGSMNWGDWWLTNLSELAVLSIIVMIMIPIQLKFGADNGRMVSLGLVVVVFMVAFLGTAIMKKMGIDMYAALNALNEMVMGLNRFVIAVSVIVLEIAVTAISLLFSIRIMEKKQF